MSKLVLGISAFYHDSAAAVVQGGDILAAVQEERFSRKKHDPRFPVHAVNFCLEKAFIEPDELDAVVFYDNPLLTWDRVIKNALMKGEQAYEQFEKAAPSILGVKFWVREYVKRAVGSLGKLEKLLFTEHHMAHAASAFYPSPFHESAIVTIDGVGEWTTTSIGFGSGSKIELFEEIHYPHSLGLLYSAFTYFCGFKVNSGEYKLMGLAPYGKPVYYDSIREHLIDIKEDGSYRLNTEYFGYLDGLTMTNNCFVSVFGGGPPRKPESRITRREMDLAASVQKVLEEVVLKMAAHVKRTTSAKNLCLAGGVALNCVANGKLLNERLFDNIWIQPAAGDAGGSLGAALLTAYGYFGLPRRVSKRDSMKGSYLGPSFSSSEIRAFLERKGYPFEQVADHNDLAFQAAKALSEGKILGYFAGSMEFGPRSLGARSILGDPRSKETQSFMNLKIKFRESFRPFAPSVLAEDVNEFFDLDVESPYMLLVAPVKEKRRVVVRRDESQEDMISVINQARSDIPAVTHVDYSARIQTVHEKDKADFYRLIKAFKEITGYGVVVNTSFNVRGEPIVCTPQDAYRCFMRTNMDILIMENCLVRKETQPEFEDVEDWRTTYELD